MEENKIYEIAAEEGFANAAVIDTKDLRFVPAFRAFCEENDCGNYGKNYGCPPYCGTAEEMEKRVKEYRKAVVFQSRTEVADVMDPALTKPIKQRHIRMTRQAMKRMGDAGMDMDGFPVMCGPCSFCNVCALTENKPCPHEEMRFSCLSAYCIDATALAEHCQMEMDWYGSQVSFFSLYVYDRNEG